MNSYLEETCAIDRFISHVGIIRELIVLTENNRYYTSDVYLHVLFNNLKH